jgi:uncharacterized protein (DUF433 family)
MAKDYIEKREGGFWIIEKRVALDTIAYAYMSGYSAESIREALPALTLEEVHGALAFYLANLPEVEATLVEDEKDLEKLRLAAREKNPLLFKKLEEARKSLAFHRQK